MNLYEINGTILDIMNNLGSVENEDLYTCMVQAIENLKMQEDEKLDNIASYIKQLDSETKAIKEEVKALNERAKAKENKAKRLKEYLLNYLELNDRKSFESSKNLIKINKTVPSVHIENEQELINYCETHDLDFLLKYSNPTVSKSKIKEYLNDGNDLQGVSLKSGKALKLK